MEIVVTLVSATIAAVSAAAAVASWRASREMVIAAKTSAEASEKSADSAQRSATAAEESVEIQRREAQTGEEVRQRRQLADVVPLYWESRGGQQYMGLVIRNNGPAVAKNISAYETNPGSQIRKWLWTSLASGETLGFAENAYDVSAEESERIGRPPNVGSDVYARLEWVNEDGGRGLTDWRAIQRQ
jgi:hypothetical protein